MANKVLLIGLFCLSAAILTSCTTGSRGLSGFSGSEPSSRLLRLDTSGNTVDAHDGKILQFNDTFYWYGTSYGCGFQWRKQGSPFCGFKVYASKDLRHWEDHGFLFPPKTELWQKRCDGATYGCFRPHVLFQSETGKYILWINTYDLPIGYRVFVSSSPVGPFAEVSPPHLAVNADLPLLPSGVNNKGVANNVNNGDFDLFQDEDNKAYIAYTDWRTGGDIIIERLDSDWLSGEGHFVRLGVHSMEAPSLFRRGDSYYLTTSDPNCGYCAGTGTSYFKSASPLGPWKKQGQLSSNSCGGQPAAVSRFVIGGTPYYLYQSDLWVNRASNQSMAGQFWGWLSFDALGNLQGLDCSRGLDTLKDY